MKRKIEKGFYLLIIGAYFIFINGCENKQKDNLKNTSNSQHTSANLGSGGNKISTYDTLTDIDGNVYHIITIGTQVWMAENLKATHFRNGDKVPLLRDDVEWSKLKPGPGYCNYDHDTTLANTYGRLYNWYAVSDSRKIAPEGWHIPSNAEWATLASFLGGGRIAGGKLKITDTIFWESPNTGASDEAGFTALAAGERNNDGMFTNLRFSAGWWTSIGSDGDFATNYGITCLSEQVSSDIDDMRYGYSVRCIKD